MIEKALKELFNQEFYRYRPKVVIQTGLYDMDILGKVYKIIKKKKVSMYVVDPTYDIYNYVRKLYQQRKIVKCFYGYSVNIKRATDYLKQDEPYLRPEQYPEIVSWGAIPYYLQKFRGDVDQHPTVRYYTDNLLKDVIPKSLKKHPLFILDSAIGFYEFQQVVNMMGKRRYYVFLGNIKDVKHFRSYACMQHYTQVWDIMAQGEYVSSDSDDKTWVLAKHRGCNRSKNLKGELCE